MMNHKVRSLTITTNIRCAPKRIIAFRADIIRHVLTTFAEHLYRQDAGLYGGLRPKDVVGHLLGEDHGRAVSRGGNQVDQVVNTMYELYPGIRYFHNHSVPGSARRMSYPLVQYRSKKGVGMIQCYGDGIDIVESWLAKADFHSWISYKNIVHKEEAYQKISQTDQLHYYRLMDYHALNDDNYKNWQGCRVMRERLALLERCLTGHLRIIGDEFIPGASKDDIHGEIVLLKSLRREMGYHHPCLVYNMVMRCNMVLPPSLAIGRATSIGFGTQQRTKWQGARDDISRIIQSELETIEV